MNMTKQEYGVYVERLSPDSRIWPNMLRAFLMGGFICAAGQGCIQLYTYWGLGQEDAGTATTITLIFVGALLTGLKVYDDLAQVGKAGTLVPITGFSNAVVSPAMEFKSEGYVLGLSAKMFSIAGPVLVYGTIAATAYGVLYVLLK